MKDSKKDRKAVKAASLMEAVAAASASAKDVMPIQKKAEELAQTEPRGQKRRDTELTNHFMEGSSDEQKYPNAQKELLEGNALKEITKDARTKVLPKKVMQEGELDVNDSASGSGVIGNKTPWKMMKSSVLMKSATWSVGNSMTQI